MTGDWPRPEKYSVARCRNEEVNTTITDYDIAIDKIARERFLQNQKWGRQNHDAFTWLAILSEEVGEAAEAALHDKFGGCAAGTLEKELVQVAAVAVQWIECIERNKAKQ